MTTEAALSIQGLVKSYGRVLALCGVDLEVRRGEVFGFLGPNGAGKTTTIRCLLDLIRPDSGEMRVLGLDPTADPVGVRRRVAYLPGELNLEPNQTAERTLRYLAALRGNDVDWGRVRKLADRLQLDLKMRIRNMSKGNKQKVGIVQAFMAPAALMLLDEPTSGLDPLMQREVHRLALEARDEGATVFFSSHIISEVEAIAERVAVIRDGRIAQTLDPHELVALSVRRVRVRLHDPLPDDAGLAAVPGVTGIERNGSTLTVQIEGEMDGLIKALAPCHVIDLEIERPSLEEIFMKLYS
ncbi:MAG: ABC transporter ATP-binding protein [Candidatus Promineofilum sp.]|nr:ABC transporter ATP-binding protein [Promineifilum sp.]